MKKYFPILVLVAFMIPCLAIADGLGNIDTPLQNITDWLKIAAMIIATIAIFWVTYKVIFGGKTIRECIHIIIGIILIISATSIAHFLVGK